MSRIETVNKIIKYQKKYIKLLEDELNDVVPMANIHGWKSKKYEEGCKIRKKIAESMV